MIKKFVRVVCPLVIIICVGNVKSQEFGPDFLTNIHEYTQCETSSDCRAEFDLECNMISLNKHSTDIKNLFSNYRVKRCPAFTHWPRSKCQNNICVVHKHPQKKCSDDQLTSNNILLNTYSNTIGDSNSNISNHTFIDKDSTTKFLLNEWKTSDELKQTLVFKKELKFHDGKTYISYSQSINGFQGGSIGYKVDDSGSIINAYSHLYELDTFSFLDKIEKDSLVSQSTILKSFAITAGLKVDDLEYYPLDTILPRWNMCYNPTLLYESIVRNKKQHDEWYLLVDATTGEINYY